MYLLWNAPLWSILNLESLRRNCGIPSRAAELIGDTGGEVSSRLSLMRSSYDLSTVVPESRRITYGGDYCVSDDMESCSEGSLDGYAANFRIGDTRMGIFLMVPQSGALLCWMDMQVPGGKGSWMGLVLFLSRPQVRPPSKRREFGKLVMGSLDSSSRKAGGR